MSTIEIKKISITDLETDAIVNAANEGLQAGGGVCGAIFKTAGHKELQDACNKIGHCDTGSAAITPGLRMKSKYIIHAVGPVWRGGKQNEPELLRGAYRRSLELAIENDCRSIGFPLISAGIFGYPVERAWADALSACSHFLDEHKEQSIQIIFAVLDNEIIKAGQYELIHSSASRYKIAEKGDWKTENMPKKHDRFILQRTISEKEMEFLRRGNIPQQMEDKWFWYMEDNKLYAHRSWTGYCVFVVEFHMDGKHHVTVNRDPEQYTCESTEEDAKTLNSLLDWWTQREYDFYNQWLFETVDTLKKAGKIKEKLLINGEEHEAVFFHLPKEPNGYLSNWYLSPFKLDGIEYSSVEQYIMYQKCLMFGDNESAKAVLKTSDTAEQQRIGRNAKGYINHVWAGARQMVVFRGLMAKFTQNIDLREELLNTDDAYLVECAGSDKIWACGIRLNNDDRFDVSKWKGQNILGFALMEVRRVISEATS